jgi:hypothetical protein
MFLGCGGTGKSYVLKSLIRLFEKKNRNFIVTASTGIAAYNIGK